MKYISELFVIVAGVSLLLEDLGVQGLLIPSLAGIVVALIFLRDTLKQRQVMVLL